MLITTEKLTKYFGGLGAVIDLDLSVKEEEIVGLLGPNGSGKTTAFNLLTGVHKPTGGKIYFNGRDITAHKPYDITVHGIGRTFQITKLFDRVSALQNVLTGMHCRTRNGVWRALIRDKKSRYEEEVSVHKSIELLELAGLAHAKDQIAENLPSAEQRRLMIAIAMATDPKLLLLDEPTAGMNAEEIDQLINIIGKIRSRGIAVLLIEHNMRVAMSICERLVVLNYGKKIAEGLPQEIANNEEVIEAYLGRK